MTVPRQPAGAPPLEDVARDVIASVRPRQRIVPPLSGAEKAEAEKAERSVPPCPLCLAYHALPGSPGCPRLASFTLDGDGKVTAGTFRADRKWLDRVVLVEDMKREDGDGER